MKTFPIRFYSPYFSPTQALEGEVTRVLVLDAAEPEELGLDLKAAQLESVFAAYGKSSIRSSPYQGRIFSAL